MEVRQNLLIVLNLIWLNNQQKDKINFIQNYLKIECYKHSIFFTFLKILKRPINPTIISIILMSFDTHKKT